MTFDFSEKVLGVCKVCGGGCCNCSECLKNKPLDVCYSCSYKYDEKYKNEILNNKKLDS